MKIPTFVTSFTIQKKTLADIEDWFEKHAISLIFSVLTVISVFSFIYFYQNGFGVAYNDARSHLNIGRRVVESLKPGLAQIGSVWLPLPHFLMIPTIWNDFFWHSGLSGALQSMVSFVATGILVYLYLKKLDVGIFGRLFGVFVFIANINVLYLTSTAMTELLLLATMTAGAYYLMLWAKEEKLFDLIKSAFWIMISTTVRYDGWFLFMAAAAIIALTVFRKKGYKETEGVVILFATLAGFGIALWFLWNILIFKDPFYFAFGPFSAHAQQQQIYEAGELFTKGNLYLSTKAYLYAFFYNTYTFVAILGLLGAITLWLDKKIKEEVRIATVTLIAPLLFNILALYLGHSVLFVQGVMGDTWFNVRYGMMLMPSIAIFVGYLIDKFKDVRWVFIGLFALVTFFAFVNRDAVTIDDALIGSSGKNVKEVSGWLAENVTNQKGFILISAASHDAIIFSSGLPMKRFIHEGTGAYWKLAAGNPKEWVTWIVMRTHDMNDMTFRDIKNTDWEIAYMLVNHYPFADIYELKPEYRKTVQTEPILGKQK